MTTPRLTGEIPRGLLLRAMLRASGTTALLLVLYYQVPMKDPTDGRALALLAICLTSLVGIIVWQVRTIIGANYPGLRAIEALAATAPMYLLLFATTYFLMAQAEPTTFT